MTPYDAVFFALGAVWLVASRSDGSPHTSAWRTRCPDGLVAAAPLVTYAVSLAGLGRFEAPATALAVCLLAPRLLPSALLLAAPLYADIGGAAVAGLLWLALMVLMASLGDRLDAEEMPRRVRGLPARLITAGVLYFALLPVERLWR